MIHTCSRVPFDSHSGSKPGERFGILIKSISPGTKLESN